MSKSIHFRISDELKMLADAVHEIKNSSQQSVLEELYRGYIIENLGTREDLIEIAYTLLHEKHEREIDTIRAVRNEQIKEQKEREKIMRAEAQKTKKLYKHIKDLKNLEPLLKSLNRATWLEPEYIDHRIKRIVEQNQDICIMLFETARMNEMLTIATKLADYTIDDPDYDNIMNDEDDENVDEENEDDEFDNDPKHFI